MGMTGAFRPVLALLSMLVALAAAGEARAAASPWARTPEAAVRLVSASEGVGSLDRLRLGLEFELAPGWKTYWRSPGDGGLPPALDWTGSGNLGEASLYWPAPARFTILGIDSIGYEGRLLLPMDVRVAEPGQPVRAALRVDYLTCSDICVPQSADLALALPAGPAQPSVEAYDIDRWRGRTPRPEPAAGRAELVGAGDGAALHVALPGIEAEDIFIEAGNAAAFGRPVPVAGGLAVPVAYAKGGPESLVGRELVATITGGGEAMEQRLRVAPAGERTAYGIAIILALALAGGLILNLMPCVLPVLGIKLMHFAGLGGADRGRVRAEFLAVAGGIVFSFWLLAGAAIAASQAGMAVGWGVQFQQPAFLAAMLLLLLLFAANLWGFFEIPAPRFAGGLRGGPFLTGMLATLLATPCSAPFVGTAVGFALTRGPLEIALIFTALGLGLALPYLAVAALPGLAAVLPRPGRWTVRLRFVLGLALAGTAVWLLTVLAVQLGWSAALAALVAAAPAGRASGGMGAVPPAHPRGCGGADGGRGPRGGSGLARRHGAGGPERPLAGVRRSPDRAAGIGGANRFRRCDRRLVHHLQVQQGGGAGPGAGRGPASRRCGGDARRLDPPRRRHFGLSRPLLPLRHTLQRRLRARRARRHRAARIADRGRGAGGDGKGRPKG